MPEIKSLVFTYFSCGTLWFTIFFKHNVNIHTYFFSLFCLKVSSSRTEWQIIICQRNMQKRIMKQEEEEASIVCMMEKWTCLFPPSEHTLTHQAVVMHINLCSCTSDIQKESGTISLSLFFLQILYHNFSFSFILNLLHYFFFTLQHNENTSRPGDSFIR